MGTKLLLLLGPAGSGKSTIIRGLCELDQRYCYLTPVMTRPLRPDEREKDSVSTQEFEILRRQGDLIWINELYGFQYGTRRGLLDSALKQNRFPVIDWPVERVALVRSEMGPENVVTIYVQPPDMLSLERRLRLRGADVEDRLRQADRELIALEHGIFDQAIDLRVTSRDGAIKELCAAVHRYYLTAIEHATDCGGTTDVTY